MFAKELNDVYLAARSAARTIEARHTEVECPSDREDGICGARIRIGGLELDDVDGHASAVNEIVPDDQQDAVREAAHSCPEQAIVIE